VCMRVSIQGSISHLQVATTSIRFRKSLKRLSLATQNELTSETRCLLMYPRYVCAVFIFFILYFYILFYIFYASSPVLMPADALCCRPVFLSVRTCVRLCKCFSWHIFYFYFISLQMYLQCFDTVGWAPGRASGLFLYLINNQSTASRKPCKRAELH